MGALRRPCDERLLGGVAGAVAARTGVEVTVVRVVLVLLTLGSGTGAALYVLAWLLVPADGADHPILPAALRDRTSLLLLAALAPVGLALAAVAGLARDHWVGSFTTSAIVVGAGLVLVWRDGGPAERAPLAALAGACGRWLRREERVWTLVLRLAAGALLVAAGAAELGLPRRDTLLGPFASVLLIVAGVVVVVGPWWLEVGRQLVLERQARVRAEERAEVASRVHDSVLQTLAMIQRHAADPTRVAQLARAQERELRSWLFEGHPPGRVDNAATTVAGAVSAVQAEVEAAHGVVVEAVVVGGDSVLDEGLEALLAAAREAVVNAAKWSGAPSVSLYVEVEAASASVYVRDRGRGFDPGAVTTDRRGLAESIAGRMARAGGSARVTSAPGAGTEVALDLRRRTGRPPTSGSRW